MAERVVGVAPAWPFEVDITWDTIAASTSQHMNEDRKDRRTNEASWV